MGLIKKTSKLIGIVLASAGTVGTIAFGALLGVGANYTYEMPMGSSGGGAPSSRAGGAPEIPPGAKVEMGIGSLNYGDMYINGKRYPAPADAKKQSYNDLVKTARETLANPPEGAPASSLDLPKAVIKAYDMMVSGAVLTSFSLAAIITSIPFIILGKKKKEN